ncbi:integrase core domain-containing protein [Acetobacterium woodii]|nr:integrase core domain-containing protein [Acetobacterium woodii]
MDLYSRKLVVPLIICSDCGSQCVSKEYQKATTKMQRSYSKMVFPRDNAYIESFPAIIKCEWFNRFKILDYNHAYRLIFEYLETFYNTTRIHSHCDYKSPDNFEKIFTKMQNESLRIEG